MKLSSAMIAIVSSAAIWTSACRDVTAPTVPTGPISVFIDQKFGGLVVCANVSLTITVLSANRQSVTADSVKWTSSDSISAPVSATGVVLAKRAAHAIRVTATAFAIGVTGNGAITFDVIDIRVPCTPP